MNWIFWRKPPQVVKVKMRCVDCERGIHKHEKFIILAAKHRNCRDPKMVGQKSLEGK